MQNNCEVIPPEHHMMNYSNSSKNWFQPNQFQVPPPSFSCYHLQRNQDSLHPGMILTRNKPEGPHHCKKKKQHTKAKEEEYENMSHHARL